MLSTPVQCSDRILSVDETTLVGNIFMTISGVSSERCPKALTLQQSTLAGTSPASVGAACTVGGGHMSAARAAHTAGCLFTARRSSITRGIKRPFPAARADLTAIFARRRGPLKRSAGVHPRSLRGSPSRTGLQLSNSVTARQLMHRPINIRFSVFRNSSKDAPPDVCETADRMTSSTRACLHPPWIRIQTSVGHCILATTPVRLSDSTLLTYRRCGREILRTGILIWSPHNAVNVLLCHQLNLRGWPARLPTKRSGFDPRPGHSGFSHVGIVPDDDSQFFLGNLPFHPPLHSSGAPFSPQSPLSAIIRFPLPGGLKKCVVEFRLVINIEIAPVRTGSDASNMHSHSRSLHCTTAPLPIDSSTPRIEQLALISASLNFSGDGQLMDATDYCKSSLSRFHIYADHAGQTTPYRTDSCSYPWLVRETRKSMFGYFIFPPPLFGEESVHVNQESYKKVLLVSGFSRGFPVSPPLHSGAAAYSPRFTLIGSQDLDKRSFIRGPPAEAERQASHVPEGEAALLCRQSFDALPPPPLFSYTPSRGSKEKARRGVGRGRQNKIVAAGGNQKLARPPREGLGVAPLCCKRRLETRTTRKLRRLPNNLPPPTPSSGPAHFLCSPFVDDRPIMNAVKYRVVSGVVWTNRTMPNTALSYAENTRPKHKDIRDMHEPAGVGGGGAERERERAAQAHNIEILRADDGGMRWIWGSSGEQRRRKREIPEKTHRPVASAVRLWNSSTDFYRKGIKFYCPAVGLPDFWQKEEMSPCHHLFRLVGILGRLVRPDECLCREIADGARRAYMISRGGSGCEPGALNTGRVYGLLLDKQGWSRRGDGLSGLRRGAPALTPTKKNTKCSGSFTNPNSTQLVLIQFSRAPKLAAEVLTKYFCPDLC
ncbi:hypothetical protein PR048_006098 [Dryococelus australis]|uniref:Uncharacterized protein n=1 Tax=Dryococelus australis TaxID=614101 RepID=A0ABQ9IB78_9NEOP|nr:hypothetical protein PR048_006098 [Dryococelus australis]